MGCVRTIHWYSVGSAVASLPQLLVKTRTIFEPLNTTQRQKRQQHKFCKSTIHTIYALPCMGLINDFSILFVRIVFFALVYRLKMCYESESLTQYEVQTILIHTHTIECSKKTASKIAWNYGQPMNQINIYFLLFGGLQKNFCNFY